MKMLFLNVSIECTSVEYLFPKTICERKFLNSCTKVLSYIREGNTEKVLSILNDFYYKTDDALKGFLINYSIECDNEAVANYMLNLGTNVNTKDSSGTTPLMRAVKKRNIKIIHTLLLAGADMMILNNENKSALDMVYNENYFTPQINELFFAELCKKDLTNEKKAYYLINAGCHIYQAVYLNDVEVIKCMLKHGLSVYSTHPVNKQTALHISVLHQNVNIVELLLEYCKVENVQIQAFTKVLSPITEQINERTGLTENHTFPSAITQPFTCLQTSQLIHSAKNVKLKIANHSLAENDYVNIKDLEGNTPLMLAVQKQDEEMIKILLAAGADIMKLNNESQSALQMVCIEDNFQPKIGELFFVELCKKFSTNEERAQSLIDAGFHLHQACWFKNTKVIQYMLEHGFPVNSTLPTSKLSALHVATSIEDAETVELLLNYGANINALDINDSIPLNFIYEFNYHHTIEKIKILKLFLNEDQISLTSCNSQQLFQISRSLVYGNREVIGMVLQSNIDLNAKDQMYKKRVLHYIAMNKNPQVIEELKCCADKFDFNIFDELGKSPLHLAVARCNVDMTKFLLEQGANPNCVLNQYDKPPLYYAYSPFESGFEDQCYQNIELLLQHNADVQVVFTDDNNKQITIFNTAEKTNSLNLLKPAIAQLEVLKQHGVPVTDITATKINSCSLLKNYSNKCQKLIRKRVSGSVTIVKLLISDRRKMGRYSGNKKLMQKLTRLSYKQDLKSSYPYYYNTLKKSILSGIQRSRLLDKAAEVICKLGEDCFDKTHIVVNKIIDCLDNESLNQLYQLSEVM